MDLCSLSGLACIFVNLNMIIEVLILLVKTKNTICYIEKREAWERHKEKGIKEL